MSRYESRPARSISRWRAAVLTVIVVPVTAAGAAASAAPGAAAVATPGAATVGAPGAAAPGAATVGAPGAPGAAAVAASGAPAPSGERGKDLAALRQLRERQERAWERGDARAYAAVYTRDADLVTFNGDHLSTRAGIEEGMGYYFATYLQGTRLSQQDDRIRFPEPDLAVIVRTGCVLWPGESTCTEEALSVNTNVAVKRHGQWLYTSFQNTRIRPLRPTAAR